MQFKILSWPVETLTYVLVSSNIYVLFEIKYFIAERFKAFYTEHLFATLWGDMQQ